MNADSYHCISLMLPILFDNWDIEDNSLKINNAIFLEDFGKFERGHLYNLIDVDFSDSPSELKIYYRDDAGKIIICQDVSLAPGCYETVISKDSD